MEIRWHTMQGQRCMMYGIIVFKNLLFRPFSFWRPFLCTYLCFWYPKHRLRVNGRLKRGEGGNRRFQKYHSLTFCLLVACFFSEEHSKHDRWLYSLPRFCKQCTAESLLTLYLGRHRCCLNVPFQSEARCDAIIHLCISYILIDIPFIV